MQQSPSKPFKGNPVAVVLDASDLTTEQMQTVANWTNLSETTFVLPATNAQADYRVRIFTPNHELPFAGHPTIGTAYALLESNLIQPKDGKLLQECDAGLISLYVQEMHDGLSISFELPKPVVTPLDLVQIDHIERILGCPIDRKLVPALVDVGARWIVVHTSDAKTVLATKPDFAELAIHDAEMKITGICIYGAWSEDLIEVRSFAPACGVNEDPVCGSGNGSVAAFIRYHNVDSLTSSRLLKSSQGKALGREGSINLTISEESILVGGSAITCIEGKINL
ncbi:PhzF family phenazine biosynthesis protein [Acinetobacter baumannii]|uniref:PhzF family phenazine biosynthesis protein n=1 Tax=Acinetobacter baumannii TaxID=470 RepID=UPI000BF73A59|nr:PhzF family phenazine biosynthesis protein [Acinetobacter baumannii]